jgi:ABC-type nitrate/sulfonate/bicarbonate transport system substrate-binding protein
MLRVHRSSGVILAALLLLAAALSLTACGGGADEDAASTPAPAATTGQTATGAAGPAATAAPTEPPPTEKVTIALDWTANVNYLGLYAAIANGTFAEHGIEPVILPFAGTPAETLIGSGKADLAISFPPDIVINRARGGLRYRAVAALVAHNTTALAVLESSPYRRPAELDGKLYGGFGLQSDPPLIRAIMRGDGVRDPTFKEVVLNTAFIDALRKDRVQYSAVFMGIDDVTAELGGTKLRTFPYREFLGEAGDYPNAVYVASDETIADRADVLRRTLAALSEGYSWSAANVEQAGRVLIEQNRSALAKQEEIVAATAAATAPMFLDDDGAWGRLQDEDFAGLTKILVEGGILEGTPPPPRELYTNELLPDRPSG